MHCNTLVGCVKVDLKRAFGPRFWLCAMLTAMTQYLCVFNMIDAYASDPNLGAFSVLDLTVALDTSMQALVPCVAAAVYAYSLIQDYSSRQFRFAMLRAGRRQYIASRAITVSFASACAVMLGIFLFYFYLLTRMPMWTQGDAENEFWSGVGSDLLRDDRPLWFLAFYLFNRGLSAGFWALSALAVSTYIPNAFVTIFSPYVLFQVIAFIERMFGIPFSYRMTSLDSSLGDIFSPREGFLVLIMVFAGYYALAFVAYLAGAKRRLSNV